MAVVRIIGFIVQTIQLLLSAALIALCFYDSAYIPGGITIVAFLGFLTGVVGAAKYIRWLIIVYGVFNVLWFLFCLFLLLLNQNVIPVELSSATFGDSATKVLSDNVSDVPVTVVVIVIYVLNGFLALVGIAMMMMLLRLLKEDSNSDFDDRHASELRSV